MRSSVGIAILGTGFARRVQIPAFLACPGADIVSVASNHLENARAAADEALAPHYTDDWRESVAHPDVDLVCITTPPLLHHEMVLFTIEQGKHILCEKPMAMNVAEAEEMEAVAAEKPLLALVDHELRFQAGRQRAYQMLRAGAIGTVRHAKALFQAPQRGDRDLPWNWWSDVDQGGGALGAIGSHIIDSFNWFLDTRIAGVNCQLQTHVKERLGSSGNLRPVTSDDQSNMLLRFADGELTDDATGLVSVSMTENPQYNNRLEFFGSDGAIRVEHRGELYIASTGADSWQKVEVDLGVAVPGGVDTGFARGFMAFAPIIVEAIMQGRPEIEHAATFADGLSVQRVLDAARLSDRSKCETKV